MPPPSYLHPPSIGLVLLGGAVGAGSGEGLSLAVPELDGVQIVVPVVNLIAAFVLGYLYEALAHGDSSPEGKARAGRLKLLLGTGFCGGLSTYSSLATDTAVLLDDLRIGVALVYALGTVLVGGAATIAGIAAGARLRPHAESGGAS